eukprot:104362-Pelagomonas_calceolata.AAC.5
MLSSSDGICSVRRGRQTAFSMETRRRVRLNNAVHRTKGIKNGTFIYFVELRGPLPCTDQGSVQRPKGKKQGVASVNAGSLANTTNCATSIESSCSP